jgi:hypothetical protein
VTSDDISDVEINYSYLCKARDIESLKFKVWLLNLKTEAPQVVPQQPTLAKPQSPVQAKMSPPFERLGLLKRGAPPATGRVALDDLLASVAALGSV